MDPQTIQLLYENVLRDDLQTYRVTDDSIRQAIRNMKEVYKPDPGSLHSDTVEVANYEDAVHRCAYLHKYAPLHTALTADMLEAAVRSNKQAFQAALDRQGFFNVCSLGGGPGNDVIAVLEVLHRYLGHFQVKVVIVDIMLGWRLTFASTLHELREGDYGPLSEHVSPQYLEWKYEQANLLGTMTSEIHKAIASANLVTMVKFVSASSCKDTASMIGKIFRSTKHGAHVLFIDNAAGGFHELMTQEAASCNQTSTFGPLRHYQFSKEIFNVKRFGYTSCHETKVTAQLWRKNQSRPSHCNSQQDDVNVLVKQQPKPQRRRRSRSQSQPRKHSQSRGYKRSHSQVTNNIPVQYLQLLPEEIQMFQQIEPLPPLHNLGTPNTSAAVNEDQFLRPIHPVNKQPIKLRRNEDKENSRIIRLDTKQSETKNEESNSHSVSRVQTRGQGDFVLTNNITGRRSTESLQHLSVPQNQKPAVNNDDSLYEDNCSCACCVIS